jgi:peptide/nickel transport system substrate-binding protein
VIAAALVPVLILCGCTADAPRPVRGSSVTVAVSDPFTSMNPSSRSGNQPTDIGIAALTGGSFSSYDAAGALRMDQGFGTVTRLSGHPLRVEYSVKPNVSWSDGVQVDAADLLLSWAANSGTLNTVKPKTDSSGTVTNQAELRTGVYFDSAGAPGLDQVSKVPVVGHDGRSITMTFEHPIADWRRALPTPLVPAHIVMQQAFASKKYSPAEAKRTLIRALQGFNERTLARVSTVWSDGFAVNDSTPAKSFRVSNGQYSIVKVSADSVTLRANPNNNWSSKPGFEQVVVRVIPDPIKQVHALDSGAVDVIAPTISSAVLDALRGSSATVRQGMGSTYEHLDLTFDNGGPFDPARYAGSADRARAVRMAFLKTIPRDAMLAQARKSLSTKAVARDSFTAMPGENGYPRITASNGADAFQTVDIAGATKLLAGAGVHTPVPVRLLIPTGDPLRAAESQLIASSAAKAGFAVQNVSDTSTPWRDRLGDGSYDGALFGWSEHDLMVAGSKTVYGSDGSHNLSGYQSDAVDADFTALAAAGGAVNDAARRIAGFAKIDASLYRDAYGLPIFQFPSVVAYSRQVKAVKVDALPPGLFAALPASQPTH